jgi:hypothetical protein
VVVTVDVKRKEKMRESLTGAFDSGVKGSKKEKKVIKILCRQIGPPFDR